DLFELAQSSGALVWLNHAACYPTRILSQKLLCILQKVARLDGIGGCGPDKWTVVLVVAVISSEAFNR
ncbi:hypothetical protein, partial [Caballeronia sp. RCC_10]|uniref:hypothetical protein n=1 Tax=Caballeronia sp. RCC_10 TaxID=3239227 RepID=UPI003523F278